MSSSLCDTCRQPGACCKGFVLTRTDGGALTFWDDDHISVEVSRRIGSDAPFEPVRRLTQDTDEESGRTYSSWSWTCRALAEDGRCTIYEDRPDLCRRYEAGSSPLCVMHVPSEP